MTRAKGKRASRAFDDAADVQAAMHRARDIQKGMDIAHADAQAAVDEQLAAWLRGENIHNRRTGACVPDFACCWPENAMSQELRERFVSFFKASRRR